MAAKSDLYFDHQNSTIGISDHAEGNTDPFFPSLVSIAHEVLHAGALP